jgi:heat shock protein HslJ
MKRLARIGAASLLSATFALGACDAIPIGEPRLVGKWEVESIRGLPTGGGERFKLEFDRRYVSGQLGCNRLNGRYLDRDRLTFDQLAVTRMACADMRFEQWGLEIMNHPIVVSMPLTHDQMTWTDSAGQQIVFQKLP